MGLEGSFQGSRKYYDAKNKKSKTVLTTCVNMCCGSPSRIRHAHLWCHHGSLFPGSTREPTFLVLNQICFGQNALNELEQNPLQNPRRAHAVPTPEPTLCPRRAHTRTHTRPHTMPTPDPMPCPCQDPHQNPRRAHAALLKVFTGCLRC